MARDLLLQNGTIVNASGSFQADILVQDGKIASLHAPSIQVSHHGAVIDCQGAHILPGLVDPHLHYGTFYPYADDFATESLAAARGGVTTTILYVRNKEKSYFDVVESVGSAGEQHSSVDFALHLCIQTDLHIQEMLQYYRRWGIRSFKVFLGYDGSDQLGVRGADDGMFYAVLREAAKVSPALRICVHVENISIITRLMREAMEAGQDGLAAWEDCRPSFCEELDLKKAIYLAQVTRTPLYVVHTSIKTIEANILLGLKEGVDLAAETCPHYLLLDKYDTRISAKGKANPPLRTPEHSESLWKAIANGSIQTIGSDHAVAPTKTGAKSIWNEHPGFQGVEHILPIMLSEGVNRGKISLNKLVEVCCTNQARIFGLFPRKGIIQVGSDADLVVIDLNKEVEVSAATQRGKGTNVYEGLRFKGWPVMTILRGKVIVEEGKRINDAERGLWLRSAGPNSRL